MTAAPDRIGGDSEYDRAVALAEAAGVRVVVTTREYLIRRYGIDVSAVCVTRRARLSLRGMTNGRYAPDDLQPGESRIFLTPERAGSTIAVLHELAHATLHADGPHRRRMDTAAIAAQECEAWVWAIAALDRPLTPTERREITECLHGYRVGLKDIRTHVLPKITR